jgi:hypothetical protein
MSSASDIPDKMARDRFLAGLKLVIADLSAKQISDLSVAGTPSPIQFNPTTTSSILSRA